MHLEKIGLNNFKNYTELELSFPNKINCFVGVNGSGKTNLLDAIHYLSLTKSAFNSVDTQNINHEEDFFAVRGDFLINKKINKVLCSLQKRQKKIIKLDQNPYEKISEHIGKFPVVLTHPYDTDLIREGSETRRRFFDSTISQINRKYLEYLIRYNHALKQRNSQLKHFSEKNYFDADLLAPYDKLLETLGKYIHQERNLFTQNFIPFFEKLYERLSDKKETTSINYSSDLSADNYTAIFSNSLKKDLILNRTNVGIHKDDFEFKIEDYPIKKFGSQGQQKSFILALKLAQFEQMSSEKGYKPLLLLDDVFDKLDDNRIDKLMKILSSNTFGQIFITDARPERTKTIFKKLKDKMSIFNIENGNVLLE